MSCKHTRVYQFIDPAHKNKTCRVCKKCGEYEGRYEYPDVQNAFDFLSDPDDIELVTDSAKIKAIVRGIYDDSCWTN